MISEQSDDLIKIKKSLSSKDKAISKLEKIVDQQSKQISLLQSQVILKFLSTNVTITINILNKTTYWN